MEAKRCDRCGNYFDKYSDYCFADCKSALKKKAKYFISVIGNCGQRFDLCPDCWKSFAIWWEGYEE